MTVENIVQLLKDTGFTIDVDHPDHIDMEKIGDLPLPFAEVMTSENEIFADGVKYITTTDVTLRLLSDRPFASDLDEQRAIHTLEAFGLRVSRTNSDEFYDGDGLYLNEFTMEV